MVSIDLIKKLREETEVSIAECKKALEESNGDYKKAKELLKQLGKKMAEKKESRVSEQGIIESYIHLNKKIGVLLDIRCESDFVARSQNFQELAHEICMQIAAMSPLFLKDEDIPADFVDGELKIYKEQFKDSGKPQKIVDQIIEGKLNKYKEQVSLMSQIWIKDNSKTIKNLVEDYVARIGENIVVKKFSRFEI